MNLEQTVDRLRRQRSDDAAAEAKSAVGKLPKGVWESVSAFANTQGGHIILGLDERRGFAPAEGFESQPVVDALHDGLATSPGSHPKVAPLPPTEIERGEVDGAPVVILAVAPLIAEPAPCYVTVQGLENGAYRRWDDKNVHLTTYEIYLLKHRNAIPASDREPVVGSSPRDLNDETLGRVMTLLRQRESKVLKGARDDDEVMRRLGILAPGDELTLAGALALGWYPQQYFPQLVVDVTAHPANTKSAPSEPARFLDRRVCEGPIPDLVDESVRATLRNLKTRRVVEGTTGRDAPEIPTEVLREAITNAVLHRDYSGLSRGQQVAVDIYPDRVEITNPGGFWGGVTAENVADGISRSRNDALARLLTLVPMTNAPGTVVENQGSGVPLMLSKMREGGLEAPIFDARIDQVKVTLLRHGLLDGEVSEWLREIGASNLPDHQRIALALAKTHGGVSVADLRQLAGLDSDDARADLQQLVTHGHLTPQGTGNFGLPLIFAAEGNLSALQLDILHALDRATTELTAHELAQVTGRNVGTVRVALRDLVTTGRVDPTAPPTSRRRAYRLPRT